MRVGTKQGCLRNAFGLLALCAGIVFALAWSMYLLAAAAVRPPLAVTEAAPVAAFSPFIEVHSHLDQTDPAGSIQAALRLMRIENATKIIFLPSPFTADDSARFDSEVLARAEKDYGDKFAFLGGGGTLNVMIQQAVHSGHAGAEIQKKFKDRAEEIMRQGASGFGEMTAEHFATTPTAYYEYAPADHPLFLLLADISAEHAGAPIDLHMEAVPGPMALPAEMKSPPNPLQLHANIAALERLLAHNRQATIVWAHEGNDNTGYRTVELSRRLLQAHSNSFMEIKVDPAQVGKNSPLTDGQSGTIKTEWLHLFEEFPDRFVVGTDQHYPAVNQGVQRWQAVVSLLNQLPSDVQRQIGTENAIRLYHLKK